MSSEALVTVLLAPLLGGVLAFVLPSRAGALVAATSVTTVGAAILLAFGVYAAGVQRHALSGWPAPLGIGLYVDGVAATMVLLAASVCAGIGAYAGGYFRLGPANGARGFWPLFLFTWGALNATFLVADLFTLYVCLELGTITAVASVALQSDARALKASMRYLMAALMGSLAYLLGVALVYGSTGALDWLLVAARPAEGSAMTVALSLMTVGLLVKAALFPLHFWLPGAHSIAPPPVSALLSALVVKGAFYILLRLWVQVFPDVVAPGAAHVLGALGAGAVLWGSFQAVFQERLKLMIAYSTIAQIGYLFLVFPLFAAVVRQGERAVQDEVWHAAIYFVIAHALAKAALFLVAGIYQKLIGSDEIQGLVGAAAKAPIATLTWGLAGASLIGLPPSGGFLAKWLLLTSSIALAQWFYVFVILVGGLLASIYVFRVLWFAFSTEPLAAHPPAPDAALLPRAVPFAGLALAIAVVILGLRATELFALMDRGAPFAGETP